MDGDILWKMAELRGQIAELGSAIRQLRQAGMDSAAAQLLITRRRAELEGRSRARGGSRTARRRGRLPTTSASAGSASCWA
jgi:hypothetical protein